MTCLSRSMKLTRSWRPSLFSAVPTWRWHNKLTGVPHRKTMHIAQSARGSKDEGCCVLVGRMAQRTVTTDATFRPVLPSKCVKNFLIVDYIQPWSQFKKMIWFWWPGLECNNFQRSDQPVARCARCRYQTRMECGSAVAASLVRITKQNRFIMGNQTQPVTNCLISWDTIWNKTQLLLYLFVSEIFNYPSAFSLVRSDGNRLSSVHHSPHLLYFLHTTQIFF